MPVVYKAARFVNLLLGCVALISALANNTRRSGEKKKVKL
jgi:hypothetical protein